MFIYIALKDLRVIFRDKKALAIMLLMPALIMLILGSALGDAFSGELAISRFSIAVVNEDGGMMSSVFINQVLKDRMSDVFDTCVVDMDKAEKMLEGESVPSVIIIPENFTVSLDNNKPVTLEIRSQIDDRVKSNIVKSVAESFAGNISLSYSGAYVAKDVFEKLNIPITVPVEGMSEATAIMGDLQKKLGAEMLQFKEMNQEKTKSISGMQYYSAAMLIMFLLFGASFGTRLMVEEREKQTLGRIMSAKVGRVSLITGKFLGLICICSIQAAILIGFAHFVYGVDWGGSAAGVVLVTMSAVFAGSGLGMFMATISKNSKAVDGISQLFIQTFTVLGGGMIPIYVMPDAMKKVSKITLNWWAAQGYNELMLGAGIGAVLPFCGVLAAMGMVYLVIGVLRFRVD